jgi:uncharacterized protein (UPF0276 family)
MKNKPFLGFGLGLRPKHYAEILATNPAVDWFEILSENYINHGGAPRYYLESIANKYPVVLHGVSMSIGSTAKLNYNYLKDLKTLIQQIKPHWVSDHLCWTGVKQINTHDLLPLPYNDKTIKHIVKRIKLIQDYLEQTILIENLSSYVTYNDSSMSEWEFLNTIANEADCNILLDVNNIYVSSYNHHFDPIKYIEGINPDRVYQIHLAGHLNQGTHILDTHDAPIIDPVWKLYQHTIKHLGKVSTMIERDENIPPLNDLLLELDIARKIVNDQFS